MKTWKTGLWMCVGLVILTVPVIAAETAVPVHSAPIAPSVPAPTAVQPPRTSDPLQTGRQLLATSMLDYFKVECAPLTDAKIESGFFSMFSRSENPLIPKCINDLGEYAGTFWILPEAALALNIQAGLNRARKDVSAETAALAKLVYIFNDSEWRAAASARLSAMAKDELKGDAAPLKALANGSDLPERTERHFQFIQDFAKFEGEAFLKLLRLECDDFIRRYPEYSGVEAVLSLKERSYVREKRYEVAAAGFRGLIAIYPDSTLRPQRMLTLCEIYDEQLKQYDQAVAILEKLIAAYPERAEALVSYQRLAKIYNEKMKKYALAVEQLDTIVARYPNDEAAKSALEYQAKIYAENIRDYGSAVKSYQRLADMFNGEDVAVPALLKAVELARRSLKDYNLQVEIQNRLVAEYPKRPEAIEALYDSAETLEDKLKNRKGALVAYQTLVRAYPDSKQAVKANSRIDKLISSK